MLHSNILLFDVLWYIKIKPELKIFCCIQEIKRRYCLLMLTFLRITKLSVCLFVHCLNVIWQYSKNVNFCHQIQNKYAKVICKKAKVTHIPIDTRYNGHRREIYRCSFFFGKTEYIKLM